MGDVIVRMSVNKKNGTYETKVIGHEGGSTCSDGLDERILRDLLEAEVPGFGDMAIQEDSGKTSEYFEEKQSKNQPSKYKYNEYEDEEEKVKSRKQDLGLGFGV